MGAIATLPVGLVAARMIGRSTKSVRSTGALYLIAFIAVGVVLALGPVVRLAFFAFVFGALAAFLIPFMMRRVPGAARAESD